MQTVLCDDERHQPPRGAFVRTQGRARELVMASVVAYKRNSEQRIELPQYTTSPALRHAQLSLNVPNHASASFGA